MEFVDGQTSTFERFMSAAPVCIESSETTWFVLHAHGLVVELARAHGNSVLVVEQFSICFSSTPIHTDPKRRRARRYFAVAPIG